MLNSMNWKRNGKKIRGSEEFSALDIYFLERRRGRKMGEKTYDHQRTKYLFHSVPTFFVQLAINRKFHS